jgi:hypothetical protein
MKKYLYISVIFLFTISCESIVDVDLPKQDPLIVINGFFTPDSIWKVHVSKSMGILESFSALNEYGYYEDKIPILENAKVEIWKGNNFVSNLNYAGNGYYTAPNTFPQTNNNYKIIVKSEGFNSAISEDFIPGKTQIKNVTIQSNSTNEFSANNDITITFADDGNVNNYYQLTLIGEEEYSGVKNKISLYFESNDILIGESGIFEDDEKSFSGNAALFDDAIISGKEYKLKISTFEITYFNKIYVVISSLSENLYKYLVSVKKQNESDDNPFAEPVSIHNNVKNGLGIFGGYNSSVYQIK